MSRSSRNPITVSISLQYFKSKYAFHCHKKWSLSIIQMFNETTIMPFPMLLVSSKTTKKITHPSCWSQQRLSGEWMFSTNI